MKHAITLSGITKQYRKKTALRGLSMQVPQGGVYGFVGVNGAGKTTTFGILGGSVLPSSGTFSVSGKIGMLPQDALFGNGRSVQSQMRFLAQLTGLRGATIDTEITRVLKIVHLEDQLRHRADKLSHGMTKRLGIAQALLGSPEILLLDEPTAGLDPANAHAVREIMKTLGKEATVVVSSHNLTELGDICDTIGVLHDGVMRYEGPMTELTAKGKVLRIQTKKKPPMKSLQALSAVENALYNDERTELSVTLDPASDPLEATNAVLSFLIQEKTGITELQSSQSLEHRFLEMIGEAS